ncbi:GNAT family N-acetyltransferase [Lentilactobacillus hilgardii]|uniref:GNAT family N-acetyltransferase n=1 Tax=Lentilactobacillus hilgardii TaxID=1588 RepID=UPI0021C2738C|nr:GNAT family N-acetyltransferase [Lentilactobacillus hilgardii]MCP9332664.1 GNAT family N-acetyltransferase [Lentilactobacillus hilgardii]MCP9349272.1 GNAT family N-acetyltransferase [Lentilactobacillus hilgardii]MCP9352141.1 GNAT family N-acetyltransferase [Lentilactobacillus hilgardii]
MAKIQMAEPKDADLIYRHLMKVSGQTNNLSYSQKDIHKYLDEIKISDQMHDANATVFFAAFENEEIVGLAQLSRRNLPRYINRGDLAVSVDQDFWNQGIGSTLMEQVIDWAANDWKLHGIYLDVISGNLHAIDLYKEYGFKIIGDLPLLMTVSGRDITGKLMFKEIVH